MESEEQTSPLPGRKQRFLSKLRQVVLLFLLIGLIAGAAGYVWIIRDNQKISGSRDSSGGTPSLSTEVLVDGYENIWDTAQVNSDTLIFTERKGKLHGVSLTTKEQWEIATVPDVRASGEGGLLGLALDNEFETNRYGYVCYNEDSTPLSVHVARFTLSNDAKSTSNFTDIITDIESQGERHYGCRLVMDNQSVLWVGTGDSALGSAPQDLKSLAGKVLRVDRDGNPASGNLPEPFDPRIYNYGHRNVQGIALFDVPAPNGALGLTSEHGPDRDDEINWLLPGNFGWDPATSEGNYDESVPMTDKSKFPDAVDAVWSSGGSTIAVSDLAILNNERWHDWRGRIVLAVLKDRHVRLINFTNDGFVTDEKKLLTEFGRIRSITEAQNGDLFITTDNGSDDKIIRIRPG